VEKNIAIITLIKVFSVNENFEKEKLLTIFYPCLFDLQKCSVLIILDTATYKNKITKYNINITTSDVDVFCRKIPMKAMRKVPNPMVAKTYISFMPVLFKI
jgi:hypothetical protein